MKKFTKIILLLYIVLGLILLVMGLIIKENYYPSLFLAMGVGLICNSVMQFVRCYQKKNKKR
ncbi:hypothetical protein [Candidatus Galacturonibacter soehngenii]|uniref:Uncharacterized protein n=1 Tax=Candidatus Galacturonatibacter soehngenii TaxID=2307010 RepID=A0A7V7UC12_9FIRM|nr:hypothetical protein [Candidatus Galacturonibacter soehngenii]KAB1438345.1 hypothetical protein F7O84_12415 [Candidatus Galacturonibacter soehngenii]MBA4688548.1 hypothetical protein [Candidatus Galacturonibacter soehngenii]